MTTDSDQTLTCTISDLDQSHAVEVTWKDPEGNDVSKIDNSDTFYTIIKGTVNESGIQETQLTIKQVKMETYSSSFTYKCSVKSSQYPDSPASEIDVKAKIETCESIMFVPTICI